MKPFAALLVAAVMLHAAPVQVVSRGPTQERRVALTFDAGADRGYAARILATLEHNGVRASFGMTGAWARVNSDLVRRMVRDHDTLINHTYDHRSFTGLSTRTAPLTTAQRTWEITETERVLRRIGGAAVRPYFRPPFGDYDMATQLLLGRLGYRYMVMWTVDSLGWDHLSAPSILRRCLAALTPGGIVLMHVGIQSQDALALQPLIIAAKHRGYTFVTVAALLSGH